MKRKRLLAAALAGAAAGGVYENRLRPRHLRWGATDAEVRRPMPGDDQVADPVMLSTRAITVEAEPAAIWPWLAQMGFRRGGLYSYDLLDRLFGYLDRPSAETVHPEWQDVHVGSIIPLGRGPSWPVTVVDPERFLVLTPVDQPRVAVTWAFGLYPIDAFSTRLVTRVRARIPHNALLYLPNAAFDLAAFVMTRRMLINLKARAEHLSAQRLLAGVTPGVTREEPAKLAG